jgi:hypothetical protein
MKLRILVLASVLSLGLTACATYTPQQQAADAQSVQAIVQQVKEQVTTLKQQAATQPADAAIAAKLAMAEKVLDVAVKAGDKYAAASTQPSGNPAAPVAAAVGAVGAALPPPFDIYAGLASIGVLLAGNVVQWFQKRNLQTTATTVQAAASSLAQSIETARAANPAFAAALTAVAPVLDAVQTPAAAAIVNQVQGKLPS